MCRITIPNVDFCASFNEVNDVTAADFDAHKLAITASTRLGRYIDIFFRSAVGTDYCFCWHEHLLFSSRQYASIFVFEQ